MNAKHRIASLILAAGLLYASAATGQEGGAAPPTGVPRPIRLPADAASARARMVRGAAPTTQPTSGPEDVALALNNAPVDQVVARFISERRKKPVIPSESVKGKTVTIVPPPRKLTGEEAMTLIQEGLRQNGMVLEEYPNVINIRLLSEVKQTRLTVVAANQSLTTMPDKTQIVDKVFAIKFYDIQRIKDVIVPMLPSAGHLTADPGSRTIIVTDTVGNLERIEQIIAAVDLPTAGRSGTQVFPIKQGDAREIVPVLSVLISGMLGQQAKEVITSPAGKAAGGPGPSEGGGAPRPMPSAMGPDSSGGGSMVMSRSGMMRGPSGPSGPSAKGGSSTVVFVEENKAPVVLMAETSRNWVIAVAPPHVLLEIGKWIEQLDQERKAETALFDLLEVKHADMEEVTRQLTDSLEALPEGERQGIKIVPFYQSHKLAIFGTQHGRALVANLLAKLDVDSSEYRQTKVFTLKFADPEEVGKNIESLFSGMSLSYKSSYGYSSYSRDSSPTTAKVRYAVDTRQGKITVITDAATMKQIEDMIKDEWDKEMKAEDVAPKVYELKHADPMQLKTMLEAMFCKRERNDSFSRFFFFGSSSDESTVTPVGRLFGQFSFQAVPNSNRLVVSTKNQSNYKVIDELIEQLDQPQAAGLPVVVPLKHANAEDLCEQMNSLLSEPGAQPIGILRSQRELGQRGRGPIAGGGNAAGGGAAGGGAGAGGQAGGNQPPAAPGQMGFWWQSVRPRPDEMPTSNLIGKIRFVPVNRRNALMVLAPSAYLTPIQELIEQLDRPGAQVMIQAVIAEVQHEDTTTLGLRIASDPAVLSDPSLNDTAIGGSGAAVITSHAMDGLTLTANLNVSALVNLLMKKFNMQVLLTPKLYTSDNQEAALFDGQDVPTLTETTRSAEGATTVTHVDYKPIGASLQVRPHITQGGSVNLTIILEVSRVVPGQTVLGNLIFDRRETTTHVILQDGQTVVLSGIVRQEDFEEVRKAPFFGDLPGIGKLFRSVNKAKRNRELVAFITPRVINNADEADARMAPYIQSLRVLDEQIGSPDPDLLMPSAGLGDNALPRPTSQPDDPQSARSRLPNGQIIHGAQP